MANQPGKLEHAGPDAATTELRAVRSPWQIEALAILALALMAVYFLARSWRKWPDPLVDCGWQWYSFWRLSQGATLYRDLTWNYGPLSAYFDASLFRWFGPGMMVLASANLVIYGLILALAYVAFRIAWGRLAAFAAAAVFISVFSFSHLSAVGNYNFATPYAQESTHGLLLILLLAFIAVRWCRQTSPTLAFLLGVGGGLTAVLKPEFMLAGGLLGLGALWLRRLRHQRVSAAEYSLILCGLMLPTVAFAAWFARGESWGAAFIHASHAWWLVVVEHGQAGTISQQSFTGLNRPLPNALLELQATLVAVLGVGAIWVAGWVVNRPWPRGARFAAALAAGVSLWFLSPFGGWYSIGRCFPLLTGLVLVLILARLGRQLRRTGHAEENTLMALALVVLAGAMLARMPLFPRIYHLGFFQAALAGMVLAAALVKEIPDWTGAGLWGRRVAQFGGLLVLATGCLSIAKKSLEIRADQTQPVAAGRDRFYATAPDIDATGALVNWTVEHLGSAPPRTGLVVLPEGFMINYLSRRVSPTPPFTDAGREEDFVNLLRQAPPDHVVLISRNLREFGISRFGGPGQPGQAILKWVTDNYQPEAATGGDPLAAKGAPGAVILRRTNMN
jgi:hypothetical protein